MVVRDSATKCVFGHFIPAKGLDEDKLATKMVCQDIEWLGHTKMILKGDNEPALKALIKDALVTLRHQIEDLEALESRSGRPETVRGSWMLCWRS